MNLKQHQCSCNASIPYLLRQVTRASHLLLFNVCRSYLLYYIVIVASEDIPAFTEITYDYCYSQGGGRVPEVQSPVSTVIVNPPGVVHFD